MNPSKDDTKKKNTYVSILYARNSQRTKMLLDNRENVNPAILTIFICLEFIDPIRSDSIQFNSI